MSINLPTQRLTQLSAFCISLSALLILMSVLLAAPANAQNEGRWYQVEVLIFKRLQAPSGNESWPKDIDLAYPSNYRYLGNTLSSKLHQLGGHNYSLRKNGDYKVLFHKAWQQQMWGKKRSPSLIVRGGETWGEHKELEGSIKIHIGRFLHVSTDLWLSNFSSPRLPATPQADNLLGLSSTPEFTPLHLDDSTQEKFDTEQVIQQMILPPLPSSNKSQDIVATQQTIGDQQPSEIIVMREKRKMRSKETHYIDHPRMGVLVRMLPIKR